MNILFNNEELLRLLNNLHSLTGIRADLLDSNGKNVHLTQEHFAPFCEKIHACPTGHERCVACDGQAVKCCTDREGLYFYRCHAGLNEAVIPVISDGVPIAYLAFGQLLDDSPLQEQWENTRAALSWYPGGPDLLKEDFFSLNRYTSQQITACAEILKALASYIHLSGMIQTAEYTDLQRLEVYLDQHYMEKLSLSTISTALNISRTKLCSLAKKLSGGKTLSHMIAERRVSAAKTLLMKSDTPISVVAESVGITDYNYFTKIFRSVTGTTPSSFRKLHRHNVEN